MQRSKSLALSFLLGALVVGGALGFTADRLVRAPSDRTRAEMRKQFATELQLSAVQRTAVDSILDKRNHDWDAAAAVLKPQMDSIRNKARQDIRQLLNDQQRQAFEALIAKHSTKDKK